MKALLPIALLFLSIHCLGQSLRITVTDTSSIRIRTAMHFLGQYLASFENKQIPNFTTYWSAVDCKRSSQPDDMLYAISSDVPTYRFCDKPVLFFAQDKGKYIHLKTLFATTDTAGNINVWAITNHYITLNGHPKFISELQLHKQHYKTVTNRNITYHFPASTRFSYPVSNRMLGRLKLIEQQWGFPTIPSIHYYFAPGEAALAAMRGMDYSYAMDRTTPSGITSPEQKTIFCHGLGEGYLHEVLHIYFNPRYKQSPMCHAMIYYLAGGIGKDFSWMISRMARYLQTHPDVDLSHYESLQSEDPMLHIDYVTKGLLCKMMDEQSGTPGLKRALQYKTVSDLLRKEFRIDAANIDIFLKAAFNRYATNGASASGSFDDPCGE